MKASCRITWLLLLLLLLSTCSVGFPKKNDKGKGGGNFSGNGFPNSLQALPLTRENFQSRVLISAQPWIVVFSHGVTKRDLQFVKHVGELAEVFEGLLNFGFVNSTAFPRLHRRFFDGQVNIGSGKAKATSSVNSNVNTTNQWQFKDNGGAVMGFHADIRGLGAVHRVSFEHWARLYRRNSSSAGKLFKRTVFRLLSNFVDVLADGGSAEEFFR